MGKRGRQGQRFKAVPRGLRGNGAVRYPVKISWLCPVCLQARQSVHECPGFSRTIGPK
jgi:hypothetical protein